MIARIRKSMDEKDQGFTLIELLVVIIIIGILAAIAIPVFLNQRKKAVDASIKSDLRTVANELETYYTDNQAYVTVAGAVGSSVIGAGATAVTVTTSPGNDIDGVLVGTDGYCLTGANTKATKSFYYNSTTGGITNTAC
jgi:prepilin-type N-terminal cleavage/methylation domain-containing protein